VLTLLLGYNFARILHNDLIRFKRSVAANTVTSIFCLDHLHPDIVLASLLDSLFEQLEVSVPTLRFCKTAVAAVAFVIHVSVHTILIAAILRRAQTE
jgi:hypothetical protein